MYFCSVCENMLYIKIDEQNFNNLIYYCRKCGNNEDINENNITILKTYFNTDNLHDNENNNTNITNDTNEYVYNINKYTKYDVTLPRSKNIKCPNPHCLSNKDGNKEVLYIRYDDNNMHYVYMCSICDKVWKSNN